MDECIKAEYFLQDPDYNVEQGSKLDNSGFQLRFRTFQVYS